MKTMIYAIVDTIAKDITGPLHSHKHDAVAVRFFGDVASRQDTIISQHVKDYELHCLGYIDDDNQIVADHRIVITGAAWLAAQKPDDTNGDAPLTQRQLRKEA